MINNKLQPVQQNHSEKGFAMPIVIAVIALVAVIGGVFYFAVRQQPPVREDAMVKLEESAMKKDEVTMEKKERETIIVKYTGIVLAGKSAPLFDYNKTDYDAAVKSDKLVMLYFYANWCPICKLEFPQAQAAFNDLTDDKVVGFRVNYKDNETDSDEKALAVQYGIPYQHTKVFLKNGKQILKAPDSWNKTRYIAEINKALAQ